MINRRRRGSSVASRQDDEIMDDSTPEQSPVQIGCRKRKRLDPSELCQQLYDSIRNIKKEDGSMLCDTFIRAPKRRQEPSYYDVVANPIDLLKVQQKLKTDSYDDVDELAHDIELLVNNAKAFYRPQSPEYQDACSLWQFFIANRSKILESAGIEEEPRSKRVGRNPRRSTANESETSECSNKLDEEFDPYEELFASVMTATDPTMNDRPLHTEFQLLPSKKVYPDYYDVIEHPIDLRLIATKIQTNAYSNLLEIEKDLLQMTKNACQFNEPGSQIYKDAKTLKKIFTQKKIDIETGRAKPTTSRKNKSSHSASIAALKVEVDTSDDEDSDKKGEGPMWALFDHLFNAASSSDHPNATGAPLGTSLWKLPYRRFHPEYFELIKRPISMCQIQTKLKKGVYANITDLTADLYLMLDNAKKAFAPTHRTHKDAVKMLRIMNAKLVEEGLDAEMSDSEEQLVDNSNLNTIQPKKKGRPKINSNINSPTPVTMSVISTGQSNLSPKNRTPAISTTKKKMMTIQKYLAEFMVSGRNIAQLFMEKPPKKLYPDYYDVIQNPIDMVTIENNIRQDKYNTLEELIADFRLMFSNCRQYNEEGSPIFEDANILEKALNEKLKEFPGINETKKSFPRFKVGRKKTPLVNKLWMFYETIKEYQEPKGKRQLSLIFTKLPSKNEYPDYYDIIKEPIDMEKIAQKLRQCSYESVDELTADFLLMLENACKYNEPDSQIYKDALVLQQLVIQMKQTLREGDETFPDVPLAVQELLLSLFSSMYNHQDAEGRCFSDSLAELPEYDSVSGDGNNKQRGISLDLIKRRLDKGVYKRLDLFQEDIFTCLERARKLSRTDSEIFEDSIELQTFYIKKRDELCKDTLSSPALMYTLTHLEADVETLRQSKLLQEEQDQDDEDKAAMQGESLTIDQMVYSPGDFVYVESTENKIPSIAYIERLWTTNENVKMMQIRLFIKPHETYHLTTRKFLEQEVFNSHIVTVPLAKVLNKCYVMHIKDYVKFKPEGFADKDVYVCESRYNFKAKCFKTMKYWNFVRENDPVKFIPRETPLELKRVVSVFKERIEKHKGELAELKLQEALVEKEKPNVECARPAGGEADSTYYQQYNTVCSGVIKLGDFVYVATQSGKQSIAQIHSIWESTGKSYFQGPWLLAPNEISLPQNKTFYQQELFLSTVQEINPIIAIVGRCAVLEQNEYSSCRPTEIAESDVYICESIYDEMKKSIRKLNPNTGLKKFIHGPLVTQDEIFHFKTIIKKKRERKMSTGQDAKDIKMDTNESLGVLEDSLDGGPPSVNSDIATSSPAPSVSSTPLSSKIKPPKANKSKVLTGYILYSCEVRKGICQSNPDSTFGDISRMVGSEWKNLPASVRQSWEDKAIKMNEENAAKHFEDQLNYRPPTPVENQVFECMWDKCDYQFEDAADCMEHCILEEGCHITKAFPQGSDSDFHCLWRNCVRAKKNMPAFPHLQRLVKHIREVHLNKCNKIVPVADRSKNYVPRKTPPQSQQQNTPSNSVTLTSPRSVQCPQTHPQVVVPAPPPPEPMFVTVPPRPQRVLHSEAYIRYIEGLQNNSPHIGPWEKNIKATQQTVPSVESQHLPAHWLGKHAKDHPNEIANCLWHLRNFMMKDVLEIKRNLF